MNAYNEILDHFVNFVKNNRDHCESTVDGAVNNQVIMRLKMFPNNKRTP